MQLGLVESCCVSVVSVLVIKQEVLGEGEGGGEREGGREREEITVSIS